MRLWHAHIYYNASNEAEAAHARKLLESVSTSSAILSAKLFERTVGPHPSAMLELQFKENAVPALRSWLERYRESLSVLIHEETGDDVRDHTHGIEWLGDVLPLNFDFFDLIKTRPELKVHPEL